MKGKIALLLGLMLCTAFAGADTSKPAAQTNSAAKNVKVIGKLGQAVEDVKMYLSMNTSSRVVSRAKAFQYLVVSSASNSKWKKVLLSNNRYGFIPADNVALLPYDVTVPIKTGSKSGGTTARGTNPTINSGSEAVDDMLEMSFQYVGTKYVWGGNSLTGGIDCSGFVKELYKQLGVNLPRTARDQAKVGQAITRMEDLKAGDRLYFWDKKRGYIGHTGIFLGYGKDGSAFFIHSSSNNKGVGTDDLRNQKWRNMLVAARR